jgi:hypothetical protein
MDSGMDLEIVVRTFAKGLGQIFNPNMEGAFKTQELLIFYVLSSLGYYAHTRLSLGLPDNETFYFLHSLVLYMYPLPFLMYAFTCFLLLLVSYSLGIRNIHHFATNNQTLDPTSNGPFLK